MTGNGDETVDATRRTRLANERTYLAWWRSGLTALAVAFGAGKLVPELTDGVVWPYELLGCAFAAVGVAFMALGFLRYRAVERELDEGRFRPLELRMALVLASAGVVLGVSTLIVLAVTR